MNREPAVRVRCPAKVNLFLEVLGRRPDGYHEIRTVFQAIGLADTLAVRPAASGILLSVSGAELSSGPENLAHAAAERFLAAFAPGRGVALELTKRIPAGAGLGGGSSDAAGALLALRELLRPDLEREELRPLAADLGSDVPFFLDGGTAFAGGRGERLESLPSPVPTWLVLVLAPFPLSTAEVYRRVVVPAEPDRRDPGPVLAALRRGRIGPGLFNRLTAAAGEAEPRLAAIERAVAGRLEPGEELLLSGSGSAQFVVTDGLERASGLAAGINRAGFARGLAVCTQAAEAPGGSD